MLNKSKGQMYPWVTHTWNIIKGKCPHDCSYCYMKRYPQKELHFDEKELKTNLGTGNFIFVGSSCDMWANVAPDNRVMGRWVADVLNHCICYEDGNKYLFQSKNPVRFLGYSFPENTILGTTIESNRYYPEVSKAPAPLERKLALHYLDLTLMVSIEPIMDFDLDVMGNWMREIKPEFISIGADSGNNNLPEPPVGKVKALIEELQNITEVKIKDNLKRLM